MPESLTVTYRPHFLLPRVSHAIYVWTRPELQNQTIIALKTKDVGN